jgi:hypothetical protein
MTSHKYPIRLGASYRGKHWELRTEISKSDGTRALLSMRVLPGVEAPYEDQFRFEVADDGENFILENEAQHLEGIEEAESHALDNQHPDISESDAENLIDRARTLYLNNHKSFSVASGMGYSVNGACEALKRRWYAINELVNLECL